MAIHKFIVKQGFIDHSGEHSVCEFPVGALNDATVGALDTLAARADAMHDAISAVTLCNFTRQTGRAIISVDGGSVPTDEHAQREMAVLLEMRGATSGGKYVTTVPGPNMTGLVQVNTDVIDLASNLIIAPLVGAMEANLKGHLTPSGEEALSVISARIIGRPS